MRITDVLLAPSRHHDLVQLPLELDELLLQGIHGRPGIPRATVRRHPCRVLQLPADRFDPVQHVGGLSGVALDLAQQRHLLCDVGIGAVSVRVLSHHEGPRVLPSADCELRRIGPRWLEDGQLLRHGRGPAFWRNLHVGRVHRAHPQAHLRCRLITQVPHDPIDPGVLRAA